jgi:hypothetical protein
MFITALPHSDAVNRRVRRLIYDDRWLDVAGSFRNNLQSKLAILHPVAKTRLFQTLNGLSNSQRPFKENTCYEVMCFEQVLDLLPSLRIVSVLSSHQT